MEFLGRDGDNLLFGNEEVGAIVNEKSNLVVSVDNKDTLVASAAWESSTVLPNGASFELANAAVTNLDIKVFSNNDRMYTIPDSVISEAKRGLNWRKEENRGGTPVGLNTARTLAKGGQIGIKKVRHIAKYFPRHEVDKKGKGYKPGQDSYPSNGRIAWALWGGDAAQRWASAIVEKDNKDKASNSITASSYEEYAPASRVDYASFSRSEYEPDFYIRIRLDGSGIDRLYKVDEDGNCKVWDDGYWDDLGHVDHDFITYDKSLDDPYDQVEKIHTPCDRESAIKISAMLDNNPLDAIHIQQIDFDESALLESAIPEIDWKFLDQLSEEDVYEVEDWDDGLMAAAEAPAPTDKDGNYTPAERSKNASSQVRDKTGKFAKSGSTVVIGGKYQGVITAINPDTQEVSVQLAGSNETVAVPANTTQEISTYTPLPVSKMGAELDFSGILGEPRVPIDSPVATLPGRLPALTPDAMQKSITDWGGFVADQRVAPDYTGDPIPPIKYKAPEDMNSVLGKYYKGSMNPDGTLRKNWNPATTPNVVNNPNYKPKPNGSWYSPAPTPVTAATEAPVEKKKQDYAITPENTDVEPLFMAIVAEDDPAAVMDLVCLVPSSLTSVEPATFKRTDGKWVADERILSDLRSPTPPPAIVLNNKQLADVVAQMDGGVVASAYGIIASALSINAITSAGGLDKNRGNAEKLRRYWTIGKGGAKIRWGTPGDWTRCHKYLGKYLGPRSKGYCALRHKEMTGMWPGDKRNRGRKKAVVSSIETLRSEEQVMELSTLNARANAAKSRVLGRGGVVAEEYGSKFVIPLVIPEGKESGDGRMFNKGVIGMRDLPLPLLWQIKTGQGHDGSVVVGQITHMERTEEGIGNAIGVFDKGEYGQEAERLVRNGFIRGVSADMDMFEADEQEPEEASGESGKVEAGKIIITNARIMAVTIVPKPAFQECFIQIVDDGNELEEEDVSVPDGVYVEGVSPLDASALVACGMVAGAIPTEPPLDWFDNPKLAKATPLTITDEGRVFGHIAAWHVDHIGMAFGTRPPRSRSKYSYFHTGVLRTEEGKDVPVGQLTLAGGHAGLEASAQEAVKHYDDTASAFADVHAGEDAYGIWVSGALRPGTTPEQIRAARASAPSGDWRPIKGHLELVAVCQVNVPGFPIARARVASGQVMALVAAGANVLAQLKSDPIAELNAKIDALEAKQNQPLVAAAEGVKARVASIQLAILEEKKAELAAKVSKTKKDMEQDSDYMTQMFDDDPENEMAVITRRERKALAEKGQALPDGSFPIRNSGDLRNAIRAYGRAKPGRRGSVRKHIMRRAKALKKENLLPKKWSSASSFSIDDVMTYMKGSIAEAMTAASGADQNAKKDKKNLFEQDELNVELLEALFFDVENSSTEVTPESIELGIDSMEPEKDAEFAEVDEAVEDLTPEELEAVKQKANQPKKDETEAKYTPETQPRDTSGKFRQVLARLKSDLGTAGLDRVIEKVEEAENLDNAGDYTKSAKAADDLVGLLERLDAGALNPEALENVRATSAELGKVIANLPFAFGKTAEKIRFSDVPPALRKLMKDMIIKVEDKIGQEDADVATADLKSFISGADYFNQSEISSQMAKLLRLLT